MFGLGFPKLVVIVVVCLLVFGPGKIPEVAEALGKGIRDFQRALTSPSASSPSSAVDERNPSAQTGQS